MDKMIEIYIDSEDSEVYYMVEEYEFQVSSNSRASIKIPIEKLEEIKRVSEEFYNMQDYLHEMVYAEYIKSKEK